MRVLNWIIVPCILASLVACDGRETIGGKNIDEWKSAADTAQKELADVKKKLETPPPVVEVRSMGNNPCFKFAVDKAGHEHQKKACEKWVSTFEKKVEDESVHGYKQRQAAHQKIWEDFPELMSQYVILRDKEQASDPGTDEYKDFQVQMERLPSRDSRFASALKEVSQYKTSPADSLKRKLYSLREVHEAISEYIIATGQEP